MTKTSLRLPTAVACALLASTAARAADTTYERLLNPEPQNWLMNHRDFGAQRFSPLNAINRSNVKNLKLAFAIALGGTSILIMVSVTMDTVAQIQSHLIAQQYEGLIKKAKLRGARR